MFRLAELMEGEGMEVQPCYNNEWADGTWTTLEFQGDDSAGNKAVATGDGQWLPPEGATRKLDAR